MAETIGWFAMSHAPQVMIDPDRWPLINIPKPTDPLDASLLNLSLETKWERWNRATAAIDQMRERIQELAPDTVIVIGDDQHENIHDDNCPPFTIFIGDEAEASVSLRYLKQEPTENRTTYKIDSQLGKWLVDDLMDSGFDPAYSRKTTYVGGLGHAFARVLKRLTPDAEYDVLPIMVNTYYPPAPSAKRCAQFGRALAASIARFPDARRVVIVGSGGLSHTKIDLNIDHGFVKALQTNDVAAMEALPSEELVDGTSEIRCWVVTAAAADRPVSMVEYQPLPRVPTGAGVGMGFAYW
ncbi:MAG: hypothetical protein QOF51_1086 [Chloroflexota bacterium]|jgi:aromatic ring-opening dioxygenase catalytic subunit (LigB family)|nr:hypothetical protein [Chloroflexota bacterium]